MVDIGNSGERAELLKREQEKGLKIGGSEVTDKHVTRNQGQNIEWRKQVLEVDIKRIQCWRQDQVCLELLAIECNDGI